MIAKLLTDHHLEFLSLKGGCTDSCESTLVKMPNSWKISCRGSLKESNICALVLLNLLNSLRKRDKMLGKPCILSLFPNSFNKLII